VQLPILRAGTESEIDAAFASLIELHAAWLVVAADPFLNNLREMLVALAARHAVPAIYAERRGVEAGGLISYGMSFAAAKPAFTAEGSSRVQSLRICRSSNQPHSSW